MPWARDRGGPPKPPADDRQRGGKSRQATSYVTADGAEIDACVVNRTGPPDLIRVRGFGHIDMQWESPVFAEPSGRSARD
jgi:hypothetical protein